MKTRIHRTAALAVASALFAVLPSGAANAAAQRPSSHAAARTCTFYYTAKGIPASIKRGGTIDTRVWYMQRSVDNMWIEAFSIAVFPPVGRSSSGVSVRWLNPITHVWQNSTSAGGGSYWLVPSRGAHQTLTPGFRAHLDLQVTFGKNAASGPWQVIPQVVGTYQMATAAGWVQNIPVTLSGGYTMVRVH